ncbi:helix-turn-helix transcriptional regulator [Brevibacillus sp. NPDC003359]|uniref:helix-turn-helix transcriptional regulator n=1 Tax=unclassified Brevibacillus TaxID=2684853 RepID=UPI0036B384AB
MKLENNIKFLRRSKEFDISQELLAKALGITRQRVIQIESGDAPSALLMLKIAHFFDKDPREIWCSNLVVSSIQELKSPKDTKEKNISKKFIRIDDE